MRYPHSNQVENGELKNVVGPIRTDNARDKVGAMGYSITSDNSPNDDMHDGLKALKKAAKNQDNGAMQSAAQELMNLLKGTSKGRIYDGFAMRNCNRGTYLQDESCAGYQAYQAGGQCHWSNRSA